MKFVKNIALEKETISYRLEFKSINNNNVINGKGKNCNITISTNESYNAEEGFS
jgi:hypothetical protein